MAPIPFTDGGHVHDGYRVKGTGHGMIHVHEADLILRDRVPLYGTEPCRLDEATGRILREQVRADRPLPPYARVAMDGIAVSGRALQAGTHVFRCEGTQRAGAAARALTAIDGCIEVMTGAVLPVGSDCVIRAEDIDLEDRTARLLAGRPARASRNVHEKGSDCAAGALLIEPGTRLNAALIGIAASVGTAGLLVITLPTIAVVSTGDELVPVGRAPLDHQVRCSNGHAVRSALRSSGFDATTVHHFADDEALLLDGLEPLLRQHDVLVLSGGVSMGRFDFVPDVLQRLGVECHFHKVRQKPGKPVWFGTAAHGRKLVFGLPGNPVSALVCAYRYLLPALERASGVRSPGPLQAVLADDVVVNGEVTVFAPARLHFEAGRLLATPVAMNGSGDFKSLAVTDGFVEVERGTSAAGSVVSCRAWSSIPGGMQWPTM
jgi:molybdopterin molybdotransferase